ncbi:DUF2188 domain-containing protein [Planococcus salinus]|uniref:DUF2188 domain-containing protein n=1 Tax=Planococcus salinus TaxID=1848460 RepID=A0A3M8P790_9BACL|nr:DUF2188 domain-containing protein [Planococcus salinus]RNF39482.1 DUF2188 domain-containing protein [Planococcus salinus]
MADDNKENRDEYFKERAGTDEARYHVVPHDEGEWAIKKEGEDTPESTYTSKSEAVNEAKQMAETAGTMVYIHNEDGQIEDQENYQS